MYNNKKIALSFTSSKRLYFLRRVMKAFDVFCQDKNIIDTIIFYDDSSSEEDKKEMEELLQTYFSDKEIIIKHFYSDSFPDTYRHSRILNDWRDKLLENEIDYCFHLEDDYLFVDFFSISEAIDMLQTYSDYAYVNYSQSYKKFPENIQPKILGNFWEWYYDPNLPLNASLFVDDVASIQTPIPEFWMTYINWPSFSLRPGVHDVKKLLFIGEFSTSYDTKNMRTELEFSIRWAKKWKSLCHKTFHVINLAITAENSAYTFNQSE